MLELRELSRRYGDVVALERVSFSVAPGQMVGFVGPNGAGKTTAMRIALGVLAADDGEVRWRGRPVDAAARRRFGYMPEERGLYPRMRAADQLTFLARLRGVERAAAAAAAGAWLRRLGLGERAEDTVESLSLGNQQRVQLAAALVHEPELLVLDEPFAGLDPLGAEALAGVLEERRAQGAAIVFSSHQLELVERLCRTVAILVRGRLIAFGEVDELRRRRQGPRRLRVEVEGGGPRWAESLRGVRLVAEDGDGGVLELGDGVDDQRVLDAARAAGRVRHFSELRPTLADVFREVAA
jgi:ABC-2 type transport system ATP-binding protein